MKFRNLNHQDDWATPPFVYKQLNEKYGFDFDPCPFNHDITLWNGLEIDWDEKNYINPPYSDKKESGYLKTSFVIKAIEESKKGKLCVMLLPVSTSTKLYHNHIKEHANDIYMVKGRIPFIGINSKNQYVNWHLWDIKAPEGVEHVKNSGQHDSMIVVFDGKNDIHPFRGRVMEFNKNHPTTNDTIFLDKKFKGYAILESCPISERVWIKGDVVYILNGYVRLGDCWFKLDERFILKPTKQNHCS